METILEKTSGPLENPANPLLVPPRSKTGRRPQRSSPLAGPVLVSDAEDTSRLIASSSPIQTHDSNFLSPPLLRPRPKSMAFDYSLHPQSLTPRSRPPAPGTKQIIRPISSVFPLSATQEYLSNADSSRSRDIRNADERNSGYGETSARASPTTRPPTIVLDGASIDVDVDVPQIPPVAKPRARMTDPMPRPNSWYITSTYDDTPKFSRLGLSDNVILPVSAKEYKKSQQQRNLDGNGLSKKRSSLLMGYTLATTLKLASSTPPPDHQLAQEPSPQSSLSESDSSPTSITSSLSSSPHPSPSRTRTRSLTSSSSSSYTCFVPDIAISPSRTSINEERTRKPSAAMTAPISRKGRSKSMFGSMTKRRTTAPCNPESIIISPVVDRDEKKLRRGVSFRGFIRFFVPS